MESTKNQFLNKKLFNKSNFIKILPILIVILFSLFESLLFLFFSTKNGHDMRYHLALIDSVAHSFETGSFGSRIFELISMDFGYGTGLFYTMIPACLTAILIKAFHFDVFVAIFFVLFLILMASGLITYFFLKRLSCKVTQALIFTVFYLSFPYIFNNIYVRFAFSELFITPLVPLTAWALYELKEENYKKFVPMFILSFSIAILTHLAMTIYLVIFALIYLLLNMKKTFTKKSILFLVLSSICVLLITATFYVPMFVNFNVVDLSTLTYRNLYETTYAFTDFEYHYFLLSSAIVIFAIYLCYLIVFIKTRKTVTPSEKKLFILNSILVFVSSPACPLWLIANFPPLNMIQFVWRLYIFCAFSCIFMLKFLYEKFSLASPTPPVKILAKISSFAIIFLFLFSNGFCIILRDSLNINQINTKINPICSLDGCGWNDDYFPKGATNESIMFRANEKMILQTNIDNIEEFANFQSRNQICFTTIRTEENGFVVINIPFELCDGLKVYEFDLLETLNITELNFSFEEINQNKFLKIDFTGKDVKTKVVLDYTNSQSLKQYLINNPFEFNVVEGEGATFKNFIKTNSHKYSVEIETEKPVTIEIPTFFYKGYKVTFKTANSEIELPATHGANGFIELQIAESGTLFVEFEGKYVTAANIISLIGIFVSVGLVVTIFIKDKKTQKFIKNPEKIDENIK